MKPSVKRMFGFLGIIIFLVATLVIYASFIRPEYERISKLRGDLATKTRFFEEQSKIIENIGEYLATKEVDIKQAQQPISFVLPTELAPASLFQQLSELARINSLIMKSFGLDVLAIKPVVPGALIKGVGTVQIELQLTGGYSQFKDFLAQVETNIRLMDLEKLMIKGIPAKDSYDFTLTVDAYYQTEQ